MTKWHDEKYDNMRLAWLVVLGVNAISLCV